MTASQGPALLFSSLLESRIFYVAPVYIWFQMMMELVFRPPVWQSVRMAYMYNGKESSNHICRDKRDAYLQSATQLISVSIVSVQVHADNALAVAAQRKQWRV